MERVSEKTSTRQKTFSYFERSKQIDFQTYKNPKHITEKIATRKILREYIQCEHK